MKHGFLILTHFPPERVYNQIVRLQSPLHIFVIHFDKKLVIDENDVFYKKLLALSNVTILKNRINITWAGFSMLPPILDLIRTAVKDKEVGYIHLLSSECLHVKSIPELHDFFNRNKGKEYIHHLLMPKERTEHAFTYRRIDKYHLLDYYNYKSKRTKDLIIKGIDSIFRKIQRVLKLVGIYRRYSSEFPTLYAGATWWSLTRDMGQYIVDYVDQHPKFYNRMRFTQSSDEILIQTIVMDSPYRDKVVNSTLRYIYFEPTASHPNPLTMKDLPELQKENIMFARKFTSESKELLEYMDKHVFKIS